MASAGVRLSVTVKNTGPPSSSRSSATPPAAAAAFRVLRRCVSNAVAARAACNVAEGAEMCGVVAGAGRALTRIISAHNAPLRGPRGRQRQAWCWWVSKKSRRPTNECCCKDQTRRVAVLCLVSSLWCRVGH